MLLWLFFLVVLVIFGVNREGYTTPTSLSSTTKANLTKYLEKKNQSPEMIAKNIKVYQDAGITDSEVDTYVTTDKWPWSKAGIELLKKTTINNGGKPDDIERELDKAKAFPEVLYINQIASMIGNNNINRLPADVMCKKDNQGKLIGDTMFTRVNNAAKDPIPNEELSSKIKGFRFLKDPCNPCDILDGKFTCPFAVPGQDNQPLLPDPFLLYKWGMYPNESISSITGPPVPPPVDTSEKSKSSFF
jgi:hypothetical protein